MRRHDNNEYPKIKEIKPVFFWKKCRFCNCEFKNEKGFKITTMLHNKNTNEYTDKISYSCLRCTPNFERVKIALQINLLKSATVQKVYEILPMK